jgi:serine protease Do
MKNVGFWGVTSGLVLSVLAALVFLAPTTHGQVVIATTPDDAQPARRIEVLGGRGATIGVMVRDVDEKDVSANKLSGPQGAVVEDVDQGSPADKAGFKAGDVVTTFDGENVRSARQFSRLVDETPAGRQVRATVMRQGSRVELQVTPGAGEGTGFGMAMPRDFQFRVPELRAMPDVRAFEGLDELMPMRGGARLGVGVQDLNKALAEYFGAKEGVLVSSVRPDSPAEKAGVKVGDVITSVDGAAVDDAAELRRRINQRESEEVTLGIVRDKKAQTLKATIEKPEMQTPRQRWPV